MLESTVSDPDTIVGAEYVQSVHDIGAAIAIEAQNIAKNADLSKLGYKEFKGVAILGMGGSGFSAGGQGYSFSPLEKMRHSSYLQSANSYMTTCHHSYSTHLTQIPVAKWVFRGWIQVSRLCLQLHQPVLARQRL